MNLGRDIYIVYASTSGNVESVCMLVADILKSHGYNPILSRSEQTRIDLIVKNQLFIFAASTWEHGRLNPFFEPLLKEMTNIDLNGKFAGMIGLGDLRYEPVYFARGIDTILEGFTKKGGIQIGDTLKINGSPFSQLDPTVKNWAHLFVNNLLEITTHE